MRSLSTILVFAAVVAVAFGDCPKECVCEGDSDVCVKCNAGFHNTAESAVFCCSDACDQCLGTPDFCITCPVGKIAVNGDCVDNEVFGNADYSSGASSETPTSSKKDDDEGGLELWHYILIGVGGAIVVVALIILLVCCIRHCVKVKGPSIGVATSQHDVLFDDEDDVDLTPVSKKNKSNVDDDAFI